MGLLRWSSLRGRGGEAPAAKWFCHILNTRDSLSWQFKGVFLLLKIESHRHAVDCCRNCLLWVNAHHDGAMISPQVFGSLPLNCCTPCNTGRLRKKIKYTVVNIIYHTRWQSNNTNVVYKFTPLNSKQNSQPGANSYKGENAHLVNLCIGISV